MAQQITNFFTSRGNRGSVTRSPVKPRSSSSTSSAPSSALKTISYNRNYPLSRDIPQLSPSKREVFVFRDPSPKPRKTSDNENSDGFCSSQESNHSSGSTSGSRKIRGSSSSSTTKRTNQNKTKFPTKSCSSETRDEGVQTEESAMELFRKANSEIESSDLPKEALDLLADEPSETYYKDLAEARREALSETLEENQSLHDLNEQLLGERDQLSSDFLNLSSANESLKLELTKFSRLNETLEEENRLLKEAMGLDLDNDDNGE